MAEVHLKLNPEQAAAVAKALDVYTRLCLGQLQEVAELIRQGTIPLYGEAGTQRQLATPTACDEISDLVDEIRVALGYSAGSSLGIGNHHVAISGSRAYEVMKVLEQALAWYRDPNPAFRGVDYDGLTVRYTQDPAPIAEVQRRWEQ